MLFYDDHGALPSPPPPGEPLEAARIRPTRLRRRLLDGAHRQDVVDRRLRLLGSVRSAAHGDVDLSANPFRVINRERAVLYNSPPDVRHDSGEIPDLLGPDGALSTGGLWSMMSRFQAWTLGCREYLIRVHIGSDGLPKFRPVAPDMVIASPSEDSPDTPIAIREWRMRRHPQTGRPIWTADLIDISDPENPIYRVEEVRQITSRGRTCRSHFSGPHSPEMPTRTEIETADRFSHMCSTMQRISGIGSGIPTRRLS